MQYFALLFPTGGVLDLILSDTRGLWRDTLQKSCATDEVLGPRQSHVLTYASEYTQAYAQPHRQTFRRSEKLSKKKEKKKKTKELQHMRFGASFQTGQEVRNICISMATLKVNSSQSPFPSSRSASDSNSFSRRDLPPDAIASALPSRLEAFPKQSLRVA